MAKIITRRAQWNPVNVPDLKGYNLYYQQVTPEKQTADYLSPFVFVGNVTEVVITDVITGSSSWEGEYSLGITAVDNVGNESGMAVATSFFDFVAPPTPTGFVII